MDAPTVDIAGCSSAHERLRRLTASLGDRDVARASALPGWTVGHVLTHLEQNAEAMSRRIEAACRGELAQQYPGGAAGRAEAIELGATRAVRDIVHGFADSCARLDERFASLPADVWGRPVRTVAGGEHPVAALPFRRWREVLVHLVDLDLGVTPLDWPPEFVDRALPRLIARLPERADLHELTAWLFGRGRAPDLDPWA